ncbi:hypothetical protein F2Q68_00012144 [Brassica cretica]|uniref:Uncharacterized protein n=1 Tax=Brassica cretica TaxID=69181 RepID=A0A8S9KYS1_BRACR|nr:hypothetical protein F2Q68_00012144 [Brassica cretica]
MPSCLLRNLTGVGGLPQPRRRLDPPSPTLSFHVVVVWLFVSDVLAFFSDKRRSVYLRVSLSFGEDGGYVADEISTTVDVSSPSVVIPLHVMGLQCLAWMRSQHRLMEALRSLVIWLRWCTQRRS